MNFVSNSEMFLIISSVIALASMAYAYFSTRDSKEFKHLMDSFRAQQEMVVKMKLQVDELRDLNKKVEWLEIKINSKNEVSKYALPQEMRVILERKKALKKTIPISNTPDYMARG